MGLSVDRRRGRPGTAASADHARIWATPRGKRFASLALRPMPVLADVFTVEEIARAAGVPRDAVDAVVVSRAVRALPGSGLFEASEAVRAGIEARRVIRSRTTGSETRSIFATDERTTFAVGAGRFPTLASFLVHGVFVVGMLWLTSGAPETAPVERTSPRLVFLALPGPGGGGGGGGLRNPLPPRAAETPSAFRRQRPAQDASPNKTPIVARQIEVRRPAPAPVPAPTPVAQVPLPSRRVVAPVAAVANGNQRIGVTEQTRGQSTSHGTGADGGTGTGRGIGDGEGVGAGIGPGSGGGIGGGPYRAGSGVEPPRLLREVKAQYTDEARRRGITGNVLLEIVIDRDGTVGEVSVRRGLGAGLDQRAIDAVRQWKFAPARRLGQPVDVIVEVAVEFMLR